MNKIIFSFLTTILAGLTTIIGIIPCFIKDKYKDITISSSLAFSAGIMIMISIISLIPEAIIIQTEKNYLFPAVIKTAIFIVIGIIISNIINHKLDNNTNQTKLYNLGIISIITLILHNIPEGIVTYISTTTNQSLGLKLAFAIALHNIPEGISIAVPIYYSTRNLKKAASYTLISGLSEFLGALITFLFLKNYITNKLLSIILAITAGIMINISITEFLPKSLEYKKNKVTLTFFVLGLIIMYLSEKIFFN